MNSNILTIAEASNEGFEIINSKNQANPNRKNLLLHGKFIHKKFSEFCVATSVNEIEECMKTLEGRDMKECKRMWLSVLTELSKYSNEQLTFHYERSDTEWRNWCDDCLLWFCYNARVFGKGIPGSYLPDDLENSLH